MYTENDLVRIAKRENNKKRNYLVVNPLQGKHIPVSPHKALEVFSQLAKLLEVYQDERILIVGFAETATAIGAKLAIELGADYIHTTREDMGDAACLYFSEEHSHATEQKLIRDDMDKVIHKIDRIIFAEDEITTGKTILNIIAAMEKQYQGILDRVHFSVASLLNGMTQEAYEAYRQRNIGVHYLVKTQHTEYPFLADRAVNNGIYHGKNIAKSEFTASFEMGGLIDTRRMTEAQQYLSACERLWEDIRKSIPLAKYERILVLGTEEFMFPGLYVGKRLEEEGHFVRFHAATRSPICVSMESQYPLHDRYELDSLYGEGRNTFIYDIGACDAVLVLTDAPKAGAEREYSLLNAVRTKNEIVFLVRWSQK